MITRLLEFFNFFKALKNKAAAQKELNDSRFPGENSFMMFFYLY